MLTVLVLVGNYSILMSQTMIVNTFLGFNFFLKKIVCTLKNCLFSLSDEDHYYYLFFCNWTRTIIAWNFILYPPLTYTVIEWYYGSRQNKTKKRMAEIYSLVYKNVGDRGNQTSMKPLTSTSRGKCTVWFNEIVKKMIKNTNRLLIKDFTLIF